MKKIIIGILMVGLTTLMAENVDSDDITTWEQAVTEVNLNDSVIENLESSGFTPKMYLEYKKIYPVDTYIYVNLEIIYKKMSATFNKSLLKSIQDNYSRKNTNFNRFFGVSMGIERREQE